MEKKKCAGKKYCDCAHEAMKRGANRDWVDETERDCQFAEKPISFDPVVGELKEGEEKKDRDWVAEQMEKFSAFLDSCPQDKLEAMMKEVEGIGSEGPTVEEYFAGLGGQFPEPKEESTPDSMPDFEAMAIEHINDYGKYNYCQKGNHDHDCQCGGFEAGAERIWKEHYLPLKEENDSLKKDLKESEDHADAIRNWNKHMQKSIGELESELKNLRKQLELKN